MNITIKPIKDSDIQYYVRLLQNPKTHEMAIAEISVLPELTQSLIFSSARLKNATDKFNRSFVDMNKKADKARKSIAEMRDKAIAEIKAMNK